MTTQDFVTLVNEQDTVLGSMDKQEAHRGEGRLHRASSVFLFRISSETNKSELLVQKRSAKKIVGADQWANTVCGNVWPDESYGQCAMRRLDFELGIKDGDVKLSEVATFRYEIRCNEEFSENEIVHIFVGWFDQEIKPNSDEVASTQWMNWETIKQSNSFKSDQILAPWFSLFLSDDGVIRKIQSVVNERKYG